MPLLSVLVEENISTRPRRLQSSVCVHMYKCTLMYAQICEKITNKSKFKMLTACNSWTDAGGSLTKFYQKSKISEICRENPKKKKKKWIIYSVGMDLRVCWFKACNRGRMDLLFQFELRWSCSPDGCEEHFGRSLMSLDAILDAQFFLFQRSSNCQPFILGQTQIYQEISSLTFTRNQPGLHTQHMCTYHMWRTFFQYVQNFRNLFRRAIGYRWLGSQKLYRRQGKWKTTYISIWGAKFF